MNSRILCQKDSRDVMVDTDNVYFRTTVNRLHVVVEERER